MTEKVENLMIGEAVDALKKGLRVSRKEWDIDRYLEYKPDGVRKDLQKGIPGAYYPCIIVWVSRRRHLFWTPCIDDLFAEDWFIIM